MRLSDDLEAGKDLIYSGFGMKFGGGDMVNGAHATQPVVLLLRGERCISHDVRITPL
ncbi:hypothetical protein GCM10011297_33850 [Bacterioplanes sanyensis]|nr:hypothetical protein GCM10011297_33850 [Bacterioplanes sanyensis]